MENPSDLCRRAMGTEPCRTRLECRRRVGGVGAGPSGAHRSKRDGQGGTSAFLYYGTDELITAGPACRMGTITLPKSGTYRIVLNPFTNATGAYRIPTK